jgi:hypothetical protein
VARVGGAVVLVAFGWWATGLPPFSGAAAATVVGAGATAVAFALAQRRTPSAQGRSSAGSTVGWVVLLAALAAWQLQAYFQHPRTAHPTLSSLANAALDSHAARTAAFAAWLVGAYRLARR